MDKSWFKICPCGHPWATHDVEEYTGDGTETCCVAGCDQQGCPGRAQAVPAPGGVCDHLEHWPIVPIVSPDGRSCLIVCPVCDLVPAGGHPVREPGWSRAQYFAERQDRGGPE